MESTNLPKEHCILRLDETTTNVLSSLAKLYFHYLLAINIIQITFKTMIPAFLKQSVFSYSFSLILVLFLSLLGFASSVFSSEASQEFPLSKYWLNQEQLDLLPEPKPTLSPQCQGVFFQSSRSLPGIEPTSEQNKNKPGQQTISANKALYAADGTSVFEGNVVVQNDEQSISSDYLRYNHKQNTLDLQGSVLIENQGLLISSESAKYNSKAGTTELNEAQFLMFENGLNGSAKTININNSQTDVSSNSITSCPPGKENWLLKSSELHLDQDKGWGYAKHASLYLAKVPVFYTPYFTFPLDERRKSGILYPSIGSDSVNGVDVALPYYINIAPNYDATLTPRILSKRGNQLAGEFRYLNALGEGEVSGDYLGQDEINPNFSERKQAQWHHKAQILESWHFDADYFYISDSDYFDDLDSFSNVASLGYLERRGSLSYLISNAYFSLIAQDFQVFDTINEVDKPYRLAPQVNAGYFYDLQALPLSFAIDTQASQFERDLNPTTIGASAINDGELITGTRLVLQPEISSELASAAYFIRPAAKLHYRDYQLSDFQAIDQDKDLNYNIAIYSLDSGLIFERDISLLKQSFTQTLEPRVKFLKIPYQDQGEAPDFDSSLLSFNSTQLYNNRRYSGHDLVGDAEQVTLGVSSKFYDEKQNERANFTIGQIAYLEDRRIQLSAKEEPLSELSPLLAEAKITLLPQWKFIQSAQWDSENNQLDQLLTGIQFKGDMQQVVNLEFRYRSDTLSTAQKETRASFIWPLSNRWKAMSFWNFDLNQHSTIELASGLEYENCCIVVKALNQKWLRKVSSTNSYQSANKQSIEIQLKGLGSLNSQISDYLSTKIPGFDS
jgi:LPS-assembly protein